MIGIMTLQSHTLSEKKHQLSSSCSFVVFFWCVFRKGITSLMNKAPNANKCVSLLIVGKIVYLLLLFSTYTLTIRVKMSPKRVRKNSTFKSFGIPICIGLHLWNVTDSLIILWNNSCIRFMFIFETSWVLFNFW